MSNIKPKRCGLAQASLICGIVSIVLCGITAIPAVICGHMANFKLNQPENGFTQTETAHELNSAKTGLIIGYIVLVIMAIRFVWACNQIGV